jgi:hypothetical protein
MAEEKGLEPGRLSTETLEERQARLMPSPLQRPARRASVARWLGAVALASLAVAMVFIGVTAFTGLAWPEPFRRYPVADLVRVSDEINRQRQFEAKINPEVQLSPASIDWLRGRVAFDSPIPCRGIFLEESDWDMLVVAYDWDKCPSSEWDI